MKLLTRRKFLAASLNACLLGIAVQLTACLNDEGQSSGPHPPPDDKTILGSIGDNHGHQAAITQVLLEEGYEVTLHIQGTSEHDHVLTLSESALAMILQGRRISLRSSADWGHAHEVIFNGS